MKPNIRDFGRRSFVTHTTGLVERIKEEERKMNELICEAECPACGEMVQFYELGFTVCPHCKGSRVELTLTDWEIIEDKEDE